MEQNRIPIICDTNIWYYLSNGKIDPKDIVGKSLVGTFITGVEFSSSPNAYKDYQLLREAVIAFNRYAEGFCIQSPVEYMKLVSGHKADDSKWDEINLGLSNVINTEYLPDHASTRQIFEEYADNVKKDNQSFIDLIEEHRSRIAHKGLHKRNMNLAEVRLEHKEITKQLLTNIAGGLPLDWEALELHLSTFDEWFRQLSIQPTLKMKINDWNDLLNLVYVQPGSLYWTEDYRKTWEFIHSCGCGNYLYKRS